MLSALISYQAALLSWSSYPASSDMYSSWTPPAKKTGRGAEKLNTQKLQLLHLFGEYEEVAGESGAIGATPKTRLNLTLVGIVAASKPEYSSVIIDYQGNQDSYFLGSTVTGTNAKVAEIYTDGIIVDVSGRKETLMLDGFEQDKKRMESIEKEQAAEAATVTKKPPQESSNNVAISRKEILSDPGKLTDYIKISPVREDDAIIGYRINPGKDPGLFEEAGLQAGDLAVELNGVDLTDMSQTMSLMKEIQTMTEISLTVNRDDELNEVFFSVP